MQKALYFMPDISGFTNFVNDTEVEHSIHVIAELLELLLDNSSIDMQLAEIEGDALFMFSTEIPDYSQLLQQTTTMLEQFHRHTKGYETQRICNCGSCRSAINLELKFIIHYGDLAFIKVKKIVKPYGMDVIKIHRLLKNEVPVNEYILFTDSAYNLYKNDTDETWIKKTEPFDLNIMDYFYKNLENIKDSIVLESIDNSTNTIENSIPDLIIEEIFDINIDVLFSYISQLKYRHLWEKGVRRIDYDSDKINQVGTEHTCVLNVGSLKFETITETTSDNLIYGEKTKDLMFAKNYHYFIRFHKIDENTTKIDINIYFEFTSLGTLVKSRILKRMSKIWENKLVHLHRISTNII
ncbi:DUF2652 domain-containing protein [Flavobacterium soyangense]|uniref:DUF2652 domain-containing protein n=1 Tax=Flavobacterium soyangense TaxID=2023265 RepID=A0A930UC44_9FLAO|nr:DUF2652 domain-containing protein [Flavobacterium soyangense]MBF2709447.1 DUF2652 domain-containing protein [Flavobacterium soyangense]